MITDLERFELGALECAQKPRDFKGDTVTASDRRLLDRLYFLRARAAGVATWNEVLEVYKRHLDEYAPDLEASFVNSPWLKRLRLENP